MTENDFPPFISAKPKGGVAAELAAAKAQAQPKLLSDEPKGVPEAPSKRKRRTAAEIAAANGGGLRKRKKQKYRSSTIPVDALVAFAGLKLGEIEQVVNTVEAINTWPPASRKRIAAAIGQLFS